MSKPKKHERHAKPSNPDKEESRAPSKLDPLWRALEWPGATGWVGTLFAITALWFGVSALVLGAKRGRMETTSAHARAAAEESRAWGFGDRFLAPVLRPNEAGVMMRNSAEPGARSVAVLLGASGEASIFVDLFPSRPATRTPVPPAIGQPPPRWVRLVRTGGVLEATFSADGATWFAGGRRRKLALPGKVLVGLVTLPATREPCVATFRSVRVVPEPSGEWRDAGEGEGVPGEPSWVSGSSASVASGGKASEAARARLSASHFAYTEVAGDFEIIAHVGEITPAYVLPAPLATRELARAKAAVSADARASGVFSFFAALLAALLWGIRRFDPSVRAEATERAAERQA